MAFRFGDPGGRIYQTAGVNAANIFAHWTNYTGGSSYPSVISSGGRYTGTCLRMGPTMALIKVLNAQAILGATMAFKLPALSGGSAIILVFYDSATGQCDLRVETTGALSVTRNGTVLGTTATGVVVTNAWVHVELKITFHPTTGTVYLGVNGTQRLNLTNQNTRNTANSSANTISVGGLGGLANYIDLDDIIVYDGVATDANGYPDIVGPIGDCGLAWVLPDAAGATTQFTPDSGANYARVSEATPDITSYVQSSTVGQIDTYSLANLPANIATVKSVAVLNYARKSDIGARGMQPVVRSGGGNTVYPIETTLGDSYLYSFAGFGQNPNNGAPIAWTPAGVNALEVGQKVSS